MADNKGISLLLEQQRELSGKLQNEVESLLSQDLSVKNETLTADLEKAEKEKIQLYNNLRKTEDKLQKTESILRETLLRDKRDRVLKSDKNTDSFFATSDSTAQNRLTVFENEMNRKIRDLYESAAKLNEAYAREINEEISRIESKISQKAADLRNKITDQRDALTAEKKGVYDRLYNEDITDEEMKRVFGKKSIESFVGLNLMNKIGVLLLIIGVIALGKLAYNNITEGFKSVLVFALGTVLYIAGEVFAKKSKSDVFSQGILGAACAVLFAAVAVSYMYLGVFSAKVAFLLIVTVTVFSYFVAVRHNSQAVASLALIGGYLPAISLISDDSFTLIAQPVIISVLAIYLLVLCGFSFMFSFKKDWKITQILGFLLNAVPVCSLYSQLDVKVMGPVFAMYVFASFLVFAMQPLMSLKNKVFDSLSLVLTIGNAVFSFIMLSVGLKELLPDARYAMGLVPLIFSIVFIPFAVISTKQRRINDYGSNVVTILSIVFIMLIIPFTFGSKYIVSSWLVEGVALTLFAITRKARVLEYEGLAAVLSAYLAYFFMLIGGSSFLLNDILAFIALYSIVLYNSNIKSNKLYKELTVAAMLVGSFSATRIIGNFIAQTAVTYYQISVENSFLKLALYAGVIALIALFTTLVDRIRSVAAVCTSVLLCFVSFAIFIFDMSQYSFDNINGFNSIHLSGSAQAVNLIVLLLCLAVFAFAIIRSMKLFCTELRLSSAIIPPVGFGMLLVLATVLLDTQLGIGFDSYIISIFYLLTACCMVLFGFTRRYRATRFGGLILTFLSLGKIFIFDFDYSMQGIRILTYFVFGGLLIGISYVYRFFDKKFSMDNDDSKPELAAVAQNKTAAPENSEAYRDDPKG